jgi:hypothetical protein
MMLMIEIRTTPPTAIPTMASMPSLVYEETVLSGEDGVVVVEELWVALGGSLTGVDRVLVRLDGV